MEEITWIEYFLTLTKKERKRVLDIIKKYTNTGKRWKDSYNN